MTIIAWDGKSIAADRRVICSGSISTTTKIRRVKVPKKGFQVLAWAGQQAAAMMLFDWYMRGADPEQWPQVQQADEQWARMIVADGNGVYEYERQPVAVRVEDAFAAWGSGADVAMGAMHMGASARRAVEIASLVEASCGNGVDSFDLICAK